MIFFENISFHGSKKLCVTVNIYFFIVTKNIIEQYKQIVV